MAKEMIACMGGHFFDVIARMSKQTALLAWRIEQRSHVFSAEKTGELVPRKTFVTTKVYSRANLSASANLATEIYFLVSIMNIKEKAAIYAASRNCEALRLARM